MRQGTVFFKISWYSSLDKSFLLEIFQRVQSTVTFGITVYLICYVQILVVFFFVIL